MCVRVPVPGILDVAAKAYLRVYNALASLLGLIRGGIKNPSAVSALDILRTTLHGKVHLHLFKFLGVKREENNSQMKKKLNSNVT